MSRAAEPLWVFYDGDCAMCSGAVGWALARDRDRLLRPTPAQSGDADRMLGAMGLTERLRELHAWSPAEGVVTGPRAIAAMLHRLPRWSWAGAVLASPAVLLAARPVYAWVARRRHALAARRCAVRPVGS